MKKRRKILLFSSLICLFLALVLHVVSGQIKEGIVHEQAAKIWDTDGETAHISVYFSEKEKYTWKESLEQTVFQLASWYHQILEELETASIEITSSNPSARLMVYGYSASGTVQMSTKSSSTEVKAYGVGGDFFLFHPLKLVKGSYFSEDDLMQDRVLLDTDTAWRLFGSNDVVGMSVDIAGVQHVVAGVYERENGYLAKAAGNDVSCVYVSHQSLYEHGQYHGLETVEYFIPDPVTGFAKELVEQQVNGMDVAIVEHQQRYDFLALLNVLKQFGTRSMGLSGITFPYWENIARGYEDILADLLLFELILLTYAVIVLIVFMWHMWLQRKWRAKDIYTKLRDISYDVRVRQKQRKQIGNCETIE